jgi:DinB superfamily
VSAGAGRPGPSDRGARLLAAAGRIRAHLGAWPPGALTSPDPGTGERWDPGQLLAHVAEMLPYWTREAELVAATGDGVAFGRVASDADRVAAIERDRREDPLLLLGRMDEGLAGVLAFVGGLDQEALGRVGTHPTLGPMTVAAIVDRFVVDHLEEHADQIEAVAPPAS